MPLFIWSAFSSTHGFYYDRKTARWEKSLSRRLIKKEEKPAFRPNSRPRKNLFTLSFVRKFLFFLALSVGLFFAAESGYFWWQIVLERGQDKDWFDSRFIIVMMILTVITLTALVLWELRMEELIVDFRVLRNLNLSASWCLSSES